MMGILDLGLQIDYHIPTEIVFSQEAQVLVEGGVETFSYLLCNAGKDTASHLGLPSWASGWSGVDSLFLLEIFTENCNAADGMPWTKGSSPQVLDGCTLVANGVFIDTITADTTKSYMDAEFVQTQTVADHQRWMDESIEFFFGCPIGYFISNVVTKRSLYVGGGSQFTALMRFWLQDHARSGLYEPESFHKLLEEDPNDPKLLQLLRMFLAILLLRDRDVQRVPELGLDNASQRGRSGMAESAIRSVHPAVTANAKTTPNLLLDAESEPMGWDDVLRFISGIGTHEMTTEVVSSFLIQTFTLGKSVLMRTDHGYIGVGRPGIQSGDTICVLAGASVPVVLRPAGGHYELVSYAFIVGLMHGEAWKLVETGKRAMQRIEIR